MSTRGRKARSPPEHRQGEKFNHEEEEERFDDDTDNILLHAAAVNAAAKALMKYGNKVAEKVEKEGKGIKSKHIDIYKGEYRKNKKDLIESFGDLEKVLAQSGKSQEQFSRGDVKYRSAGYPRKQRQCSECERKDGIIQNMLRDEENRKRRGNERDTRDVPEKVRSIEGFNELDGRHGKPQQSDIDQLQHLHGKIKQLQTENDILKAEIQTLKAGSSKFQTQMNELETALNKETIAKADAQGRIQTLGQDIRKLEASLVAEKNSKDDINKQLQTKCQEAESMLKTEKNAKENAMRQIQAMSQDIRTLEANLESEKTAIDGINKQFQTKCQEAERINLMLKTEKNAKENVMRQIQAMSQDIKSLEANLESEKNAKDGIIIQFQTKCQEAESTHLMLKTERNAKENVIRQMNVQHQEIQKLEATVRAEKAAKDDALRRLSAMVSSRLRDNNPNITDLSDQNRPTKLAEKMSELYDNEWTDAFDELEANTSDINFIKCLLDTLMDIFNECKMWSLDNFFEKVLWTIERSYPDERSNYENTDVEVVLSTEMKQQIKEVKKTQGRKVLPSIEKMIYDRIPRLKQNLFTLSAMKIYIKKCIEISWLAVVQDPPLALNVGNSVNFDTKLFKEYLKRGPYVEFVVWPALHIEEGGALLCKGVAQGCKERKERQPTTATDD